MGSKYLSLMLAETVSWSRWRNFGQGEGPDRLLEAASSRSLKATMSEPGRQSAMRWLVPVVVLLVEKCLSLKFWSEVGADCGLCVNRQRLTKNFKA